MTQHYEFITEHNLGDYILSRPNLAQYLDGACLTDVKEIGDGNLNLVFIATDAHGKSLCIKQALPYVRMVGEGWPMTPDRARHEASSLMAYAKNTPDLVVKVLDFDPDQYVTVMEDLSDHKVWRTSLNNGEICNGAAEAMGTYVGALAFHNSLFALGREELGQCEAEAINPQLCEITEDLVFTEPSVDLGRNEWLLANEADAKALSSDMVYRAAMAEAKWKFMTQHEAWIHGDLHTGSIMIHKAEGTDDCDSVKAFDSEFSFLGPVGFDMGALWANFVIAAARAYALGETDRALWILEQLQASWNGFSSEFTGLWPQCRDPRMWDETFLTKRLNTWLADSWLFAAAKMSRRVVGVAKTSDLTTLPDNLGEGANRGVLLVARHVAANYLTLGTPQATVSAIAAILADNATNE